MWCWEDHACELTDDRSDVIGEPALSGRIGDGSGGVAHPRSTWLAKSLKPLVSTGHPRPSDRDLLQCLGGRWTDVQAVPLRLRIRLGSAYVDPLRAILSIRVVTKGETRLLPSIGAGVAEHRAWSWTAIPRILQSDVVPSDASTRGSPHTPPGPVSAWRRAN